MEDHKSVHFHDFNVVSVGFWGLGDMDGVKLLCEWEKASILDLKSFSFLVPLHKVNF